MLLSGSFSSSSGSPAPRILFRLSGSMEISPPSCRSFATASIKRVFASVMACKRRVSASLRITFVSAFVLATSVP